jgi:integrase
MNLNPQDKARQENTKRLLGRVSDANRPGLEAHIEQARNQTLRENSLYSFAVAVAHADRALQGKDFLVASPQDYVRVVSSFRGIYSPQSLRIRVVNLRKHVRWVHNVDRLSRELERALWVRRERDLVVGQVISPEDFAALLGAIEPRASLTPVFPVDVRDRALWSVLRASGFRISEFVSLNVSDVKLEGDVALLCLRRDAPDLKTGARSIYIKDGVAELRAWLSVHPARGDPHAPLFIQPQAGGIERASPLSIRKLLSRLCRRAGLDRKLPAPLTPHDFRHTCATEKARLGWNESQLRLYFGWGPGSKTPSTYVHLSMDDQRNRILRDAQTAAMAPPAPAPVVRLKQRIVPALELETLIQTGWRFLGTVGDGRVIVEGPDGGAAAA